ncbi:hypothetical protein CS0771_68970 [Catellatospora sp. IY07-71]|uniref:hypothetical protein n=1 Tax=Catellatospora sp. IY07-71 TaxID=2728827 RepID=UPI001BB3C12A|nr:hypothetical protein [Catellatospora sp. IY07-71]BCJ77353.1 hypothetical protein CS0771_68970 [Catellatospora sp. IY07-71]
MGALPFRLGVWLMLARTVGSGIAVSVEMRGEPAVAGQATYGTITHSDVRGVRSRRGRTSSRRPRRLLRSGPSGTRSSDPAMTTGVAGIAAGVLLVGSGIVAYVT